MRKITVLSMIVAVLTIVFVNRADTQTEGIVPTLMFETNLSHNDICLIKIDGTNLYCLMETDDFFDHHPVWSPDGRFVAYQSIEKPVGIGSSSTYIYDIENQTAKELSVAGKIFDWSTDGRLLLISAPDAETDSEIYVLNQDGSGMQQLTDNAMPDTAPAWSPDADQIVYLSGYPEAMLMVMSASGENSKALTTEISINWETQPQWSPDGNMIAFVVNGDVAGRDQTSEIYTIHADGTNLQQITETGGINLGPDWSPDGNQLVFYGYAVGAFDDMGDPASLRTEVFRIDAEGGESINLTQSTGLDYHPRWSPDGEWIVFASTRQSPGIFIMRPDGSDLRMVTNEPPFSEGGREANNPVWQPLTQ